MTTHPTVTLILPLPPSRNALESMGTWVRAKAKNDYKRKAWFAAIGQHQPRHEDHLPEHVHIHLTFYTKYERDDDGCDPKLVVDTLKARQRWTRRTKPPTDGPVWRNGVSWQKGYYIDDEPRYARIVGIPQKPAVDIEPCVVVKITPREAA